MAALDVSLILRLVDRASGPAKGIMNRIFGETKGGPAGAINAAGLAARGSNAAFMALNRQVALFGAGAAGYIGFKSMIGGAVEFEAAMADVSKKVDMAPDEFNRLTKSIQQLARTTPLAQTEIAKLVANAGTFGIANKDLTRFAMLGSKASVAFDMSADQVSTSLANIKAALKLNMGQLEQYADAINYVADTSASSEEQLIDFVLRTGSGAMSAGVDPKHLLSIGSAMIEVGISSQRAGTSVNAMLTKMSALSDKKGAGKILDKLGGKGYSKKLQREFFENPTKALTKLLKLTAQMSRPDRAGFMKDLFGLETQDEVNALAGNVDRMVGTMEKLGDSSRYIGSVQKTFDGFAKTTESQWKQFTNNVEMAGSAIGASLLPPINGALQYLNNFFATGEGRLDVFERMSEAANGFFTGLGYTGGTAEALEKIGAALAPIRDFLFGVQGDANFGVGGMKIFEQWKLFGEQMAASPISTIFTSLGNADLASVGGGLVSVSAGMGLLSIAASMALSPLNLIWEAMKGIVKTAYTLSGLRTAKWLLDLAGGLGGGGSDGKPKPKGGGGKPGSKPGAKPMKGARGLLGAIFSAAAVGAGLYGLDQILPEDSYFRNMGTENDPSNVALKKEIERLKTAKHAYPPAGSPTKTDATLPVSLANENLSIEQRAGANNAGGSGTFANMLAGIDNVKMKAAEMATALNVSGSATFDKSQIDAALASAQALVAKLGEAGMVAAGINANVGAKVSQALRANLADGGDE